MLSPAYPEPGCWLLAQWISRLEPSGLHRANGKRPDGMTMVISGDDVPTRQNTTILTLTAPHNLYNIIYNNYCTSSSFVR